MNQEKFAAELVCLLDVASAPPHVADLKQHVESFFIAGAARIDLIAEIMNLDNDIGGYNFDIPLLEQTEKAIKDVAKAKGNFAAVAVQASLVPIYWPFWSFIYFPVARLLSFQSLSNWEEGQGKCLRPLTPNLCLMKHGKYQVDPKCLLRTDRHVHNGVI